MTVAVSELIKENLTTYHDGVFDDMRVWIFEVAHVMYSFHHPNGGLIVIAKDWDHVLRLVDTFNSIDQAQPIQTYDIRLSKEDKDACVVYYVGLATPKIIVFPNVGCCS